MRLEIKEWNNIQEVFVDTFGWKDGIKIMIDSSRDIKKDKAVYEMTPQEDRVLIRHLRTVYNKEAKCLEKEKAK
jgi:hypothetical protein